VLKQAPNAPMELYKQVIIVLAAAYGFISPFVRDFKRDLSSILTYEAELFAFLSQGSLHQLFKPIFELYHLADKEDFNFNKNPLLFCLKYFNAVFFCKQNA
jgi:hypothetical protein